MRVFMILTFLSAICARAGADDVEPFDLKARGDQVCKFGPHYPEPVCYPSASAADTRFSIPREIDVMEKVRNYVELVITKNQTSKIDSDRELVEVGAALFMRDEDITMLYDHYRALNVNNMGIDLAHAVTKENETLIPFVASLDWQGVTAIRGTLHMEGFLKFPKGNFNVNEHDTFADLNALFARQLDVRHFNDAAPLTSIEASRFLQTVSRHFQLTRIYGLHGDRQAQTQHLLQDVIGPAIIGEYIYLPLFKSQIQKLKTP